MTKPRSNAPKSTARRYPAPRTRAGIVQGKKIKSKHQLRLASLHSHYWKQELELGRAQFPPATDTSAMQCCATNTLNLQHVVPAYYLTFNDQTQRHDCEECLLDRTDRWLRGLAREGAIADDRTQDREELNEQLRAVGLPVTHSESAAAIAAAADGHIEVIQMKLEPEDVQTLDRQVRRYRQLASKVGQSQAIVLAFGEAYTQDF